VLGVFLFYKGMFLNAEEKRETTEQMEG
jgi:hypothetical protein